MSAVTLRQTMLGSFSWRPERKMVFAQVLMLHKEKQRRGQTIIRGIPVGVLSLQMFYLTGLKMFIRGLGRVGSAGEPTKKKKKWGCAHCWLSSWLPSSCLSCFNSAAGHWSRFETFSLNTCQGDWMFANGASLNDTRRHTPSLTRSAP